MGESPRPSQFMTREEALAELQRRREAVKKKIALRQGFWKDEYELVFAGDKETWNELQFLDALAALVAQ